MRKRVNLVVNNHYKNGMLICSCCEVPINKGEKYLYLGYRLSVCSLCIRELSYQVSEDDITKIKGRQIIEELKFEGKDDKEW